VVVTQLGIPSAGPAKALSDGMNRGCSGVVRPVRGDRVEIVIDAGGEAKTYEVTATRAGRRVDVRTGRVWSRSAS
jgi:hypothetical protein